MENENGAFKVQLHSVLKEERLPKQVRPQSIRRNNSIRKEPGFFRNYFQRMSELREPSKEDQSKLCTETQYHKDIVSQILETLRKNTRLHI